MAFNQPARLTPYNILCIPHPPKISSFGRIQTITNGTSGNISQALGLASHISELTGWPIQQNLAPSLKDIFIKGTLGKKIKNTLSKDIVIGCGSDSHLPLLITKYQSSAFIICIQTPPLFFQRYFDAIVAPYHDYDDTVINNSTTNPRLVLTIGAVNQIDVRTLSAHRALAKQRFNQWSPPFISVLIGGNNRAYQLDIAQLIQQLQAICHTSGSTLLITTSQRSPPEFKKILQQTFSNSHFIWDGQGDNPYFDMLAAADGFCVTWDSVNMISEACSNGRSIYLLPMAIRRRASSSSIKKFNRFHQTFINNHHVRLWQGQWQWFSAPPLTQAALAAKKVWSLYQQRLL